MRTFPLMVSPSWRVSPPFAKKVAIISVNHRRDGVCSFQNKNPVFIPPVVCSTVAVSMLRRNIQTVYPRALFDNRTKDFEAISKGISWLEIL